ASGIARRSSSVAGRNLGAALDMVPSVEPPGHDSQPWLARTCKLHSALATPAASAGRPCSVPIEVGAPPWEPAGGVALEHSSHVWDYPRWGYFKLDGARLVFHRHENVGAYTEGPSRWTYRALTDDDLAALSMPEDHWGEPWRRAYAAWHA